MSGPDGSDGSAPGDGPASEDDAPRVRGLAIAVTIGLALIGAAGLLVVLLQLGDRGNTIAGPTSLFVGIVAALSTITIWLIDKGYMHLPGRSVRRATLAFITLLTAGVVASSVVVTTVAFADRQIPITESVEVTGARGMIDGSQAVVTIPAPARRSGLAITFSLDSANPEVGNCGGSAELTVALRIDGVPRQVVDGVARGTEVRFALTTVVDSAAVVVTTRVPRDPGCRLNLSVAQATLFTLN